jgi:hypothetical protein
MYDISLPPSPPSPSGAPPIEKRRKSKTKNKERPVR